ncbi:MAG TPA: thiolase family protein [Deltaproteobacteria bacterium]|nr:thiolase family protein [Deltaproteobacteria bacterium]HNQ84657.1 thiolase family protein [Deltaproteobacteria bacterium]HNS88513.1 thiolase family protein [Deltaproteobacteria bacterium]HOA43417.1 thiolase family protein [Deltaproteobacteria bacterium]HOC74679.1 thiolase family protein [Deltaproteobacteria bacterium]
MREAYIVQSVRTPGCRRGKGALAYTRPEDLLKTAINGLMDRAKGVEKKDVEDVLIGCAFPEAEQGLNIGRIIAQMCKFPDDTCGATVNRFCSSGLEGICLQGMRIMAGMADVCIGGGLESMSIVPMGGNMPRPHPEWSMENPDVYTSMGITAENVANRYKITREMQDEFGFHSQAKAAQAQKNGKFKEIVPVNAVRFKEKNGITVKETFVQDFDDGVRPTTMENLAKLRPAFAAMGSVTAGNSSQTTDGAACSLIMSGDAVKKYGVKPIAKMVAYVVAGCRADEMGVGPAYAIPKLLKVTGKKVEDINLWEVNEAFASQCIYSLQQLGLYEKRELWLSDSDKRIINVNGGAIALGHPLGCTGAKLCAQLMTEMQARGAKYGVESMCIGGGMGAAALFELCD